YLISEVLFFLSAFWVASLSSAFAVSRRVLAGGVAWAVTPLTAVGLALGLLAGTPRLHEPGIQLLPPHEIDVARAAARSILGPDATIASRHLTWYTAGAEHWFRLEKVITEPKDASRLNLPVFFSQFDAVADFSIHSSETQSGVTPSSVFASGELPLQGFY